MDFAEPFALREVDEIALVEVHHRIRLLRLQLVEDGFDSVFELLHVRGVERAVEPVQAVDRLKQRDPSAVAQDAEELGEGLALAIYVDEDRAGRDDVYRGVLDV